MHIGRFFFVQQFRCRRERCHPDFRAHRHRPLRQARQAHDARGTQAHEPHGVPRVLLLHDVREHLPRRFRGRLRPEPRRFRHDGRDAAVPRRDGVFHMVRKRQPQARLDGAGHLPQQLRHPRHPDCRQHLRRRGGADSDDDDCGHRAALQHLRCLRARDVPRRQVPAHPDSHPRAQEPDD